MRRGLIGLLAVAAVAGGVILATRGSGDGKDVVRAEFENASGLRPGSLVRVSGASVGSVKSLHVTARNTALVKLSLNEDVSVGTGAAAAIRPANLLGEKFVDLTVGDRARPLRSGVIGLARTSTPVELDDVLNVLDPTTRGRLGLLLGELGIGLGGRGRDLSGALNVAPRTVQDAADLFNQVSADTRVLQRLLSEADRVAAAIARERRPLGALVATGERALAAPAARRAQLASTLREAPPTLAQLRKTLGRLDRAGSALRPAARGLRATAPTLEAALRALPGFERAAAPALATVTDVAPSLAQLGRKATPTVRRLRPTIAALRDLSIDADPLTRTLDISMADLLGVVQGWALAIQGRDAASHLFRVSLSLTPDALRQLDAFVTRVPSATSRGGGRVHPRAGDRPRDQVTAPVHKTLDTVTPAVRRLLGDKAAGAVAPSTSLKPLLDYLLR
jgi:phospholipid/cholesterol/gamma-HCH transport system substrate-binding protein